MSDFNSDSEETEQRDNRLKLRTFFTLFFEGDFLPMNELNISAVDATAMETATTTSAPKHKWLSKLTRGAKKATMFCTVAGIMASTCATQAFAAGTGEVDTSSFITTACTVLKSVICLIGGGVSLWGVVNLLEGYGNDNPGANADDTQRIYINLSYLVIIILNFLMFYVIYSLFFKNAQIKNMKVLSVKEQYMEQYVNNAETQYELIRKIRHDIKDQLTTVYELLTSGKTEDALEFIEQSNGIVKATMTFVQTNNPVANAIINSKLSTASTLGIKVSCITVNDFVGINELDLCDLLSNTLENAITACEAMPPDLNKFIYLEISKENNIYTFIVKNSLDKSVISENPKLKTTKKDIINHGLGTSIIRDIVNKYSGRYDYYEIDNAFCCSIILET